MEKLQRTIGQNMAVTREAGDFAYLSVRHALEMDRPTLRQNMQNTLFVL